MMVPLPFAQRDQIIGLLHDNLLCNLVAVCSAEDVSALLLARGLFSRLRQTMADLSFYLEGLLQDPDWSLPPHLSATQVNLEIIALAAPAIIERLPRAGLIALVPSPDCGRGCLSCDLLDTPRHHRTAYGAAACS
jgi:hypothetical protein